MYWGNSSPSSTSQQDHGSEEAYEDVQQQPKDPGEVSDPTTFISIVQTESSQTPLPGSSEPQKLRLFHFLLRLLASWRCAKYSLQMEH